MATERSSRKLAVILHADVAGSTALVRRNETLAHERIQDAFRRFCGKIRAYNGIPHELRGDALLAAFSRASDAVSAALSFQAENTWHNDALEDDIRPAVRIGISLGEVIIADDTLTGPDVVLAQRIEQLAEPGGICIQSTAYETIPGRLPFDYISLGEQAVKGFDEPVRVYAVKLKSAQQIPAPEPQTDTQRFSVRPWLTAAVVALLLAVGGLAAWLQPWKPDIEPADPARMAYALPERPSIAVLPFDNMSTDEDQAYFADGITEDIITDLSKISGLFVVARNSSFTYKGTPVKIRQVAEELGVRYVLEGSVRRSGDRIRISAQLIDALKGNHLWAERYDRELRDVFAVQSEVTQRVVKALAMTLKASEHERLFQKHTANIDAYDVFLRARRMVDSPSRENIERGEVLFKRVIELDPNFAGGYAGLSFNHSVKARFQYSTSPELDVQRSLELARKAIELDRHFAWSYIALGGAHLANGDPDAAVEAVRQALVIQPNGYEENLFMGLYLQFAGQSALAVEHLEFAKRMSPVDTARNLGFLGMAYFMNRNYGDSEVVWSRSNKQFEGRSPLAFVFLAANYALLDRPSDAASAVAKLLALQPGFNLSEWRWIRAYKSPENRQRLYDAAKKAGIPEQPG